MKLVTLRKGRHTVRRPPHVAKIMVEKKGWTQIPESQGPPPPEPVEVRAEAEALPDEPLNVRDTIALIKESGPEQIDAIMQREREGLGRKTIIKACEKALADGN